MVKKKVLIIVDAQNDFISGCLGSEEAISVVPRIKRKIEEYVALKEQAEILFTQDTHYGDYLNTPEGKKLPIIHCLIGEKGWEIEPSLDLPNCTHVFKDTFGFRSWNFRLDFKEIESIELVGYCTDICVITNALLLKTFAPNIEITVDASCCAGVTPERHKAALEVMTSCQINVINE